MKKTMEQNSKTAKIAVVVACFIMVFACLGFCSSNKSLYLNAITEALNIKRSLFSLSDSCRFISVAIINLFFGTLIHKFGAKKLIGAGFLSLIISTLIFAYAEDVAVFCLGGCFLGIGLAWTSTTMASYLVNRWFKENRGTMSGLVLCANGLGGALAAQIITPIIYEEGNPFGYRNAYLLVTAILLVVGILVVLLVREPSGEAPANVGKKKIRGKSIL
jgi:MFS family permease